MTILYATALILLAISALATFVVVGRQALRRVLTQRLLAQSAEVRGLLQGMRERNYKGIDKLLFDMRDSYDLTVIEDELGNMLGEASGDGTQALRKAFDLLGLTTRYLDRLRNAGGWQERARSATALGHLGDSRAVTPLLEAMRDKREDSDVKLASAEALGRIRDPAILAELCAQLGDVDEWSSPRLAQVITAFGADAVTPLLESLDAAASLNARVWTAQILGKIRDRRATPALIKRLSDRSEQMRISVANALGDIADNRAFRPLVEVILRDPVSAVRAQAATSLGRIGDEGALPLLVASMGDPEYWMRFRALEAIEALEPEDTGPIETALSDTSPEVRRRAALALERLGKLEEAFTNLQSADPDLEAQARARLIAVGRAGLSERLARHLDDDNVFMRERIASLMGPVGDPKHAPDLLRRLEDTSDEVRFAAIESLGDLGARSTTQALLALLSHSDAMHRVEAVKALVRYPNRALEDGLPTLIELLQEESDEVRFAAIQVVAMVGGENVDALLQQGLLDRYIETRVAAARLLGERRVSAAIPELGRCLADPNDTLRTEAATALGMIGGQSAIDLLLAAMPNTSGEQRDSICATLAALGFDAVRPLLDVLMASDDMKTRLGAIWTLGKTGDVRATRLLRYLLMEDDTLLRSSAAGALGKIACSESIVALKGALGDPSPFVRSASVNGLGRIGARSDLEVIAKILHDPDAFVRNRAAIAVGRLGGEEAHTLLAGIATDALDPAMRVIAMGLTGSASGIGEPLQAMRDPLLRNKVSVALEQEEEAIRVVFFSNLTPRATSERGQNTEEHESALEPEHLLGQFVEAIRNSQDLETRRRAAAALGSMNDDRARAALCLALGHDPDEEVRCVAADGLARHTSSGDARDALLKAIVDPAPGVRQKAIGAAGTFAKASDAQSIFESLRSSNAALVEVSEEALARIFAGPVEGVHDWIMGQESPAMQASGLRILGRIGDARSLGLIGALLRAEEPQVRIESARALAALQVPDAIRAMLDALGDPIESVRVGIVQALAGTTRADVVERLEKCCFDPSLRVRRALTETLSTLRSSKALEILETLASDTDPTIAGGALLGLLRSPDTEGQHKLLSVLPHATADARRILRKEADLGIDVVRDQVRSALDADLRKLALRVLAAIDSTRYAGDMASALQDPDATVRLAAVGELAQLEPERVGDWLKALLDDPVEDVRLAAKRALFRVV